MTIEEIKALTSAEAILARGEEIKAEMRMENADLDALANEVKALEKRKAEIAQEMEARKADMTHIINGEGQQMPKPEQERKMDIKELRNSAEYVNAFAEYVKTGDLTECRRVLTQNALADNVTATDGQVPTPDFVQATINTAWESDKIFNAVRKTYMKGNLKVGFELSSTGAVIHAEGAAAVDPETLKFGIVTLVPSTIKKYVLVSDETLDLGAEEFLKYIYSELTYQIVKKAVDTLIAAITSAPTTATATAASVAKVAPAGAASIVMAEAELSDEAQNVVCIMHKKTRAYLKKLAMQSNYAVDPFDDLDVYYNNTLDVMTGAEGETGNFIIVGDLSTGAQMNFTNGQNVQFKYDDLSEADSDMVKVIGRMPAGIGVVACGRFAVVHA